MGPPPSDGPMLPTPGDDDDEIRVYTDPLAGTFSMLLQPGTPVLAPLGSADLLILGPGGDFLPLTGNETVSRLAADTLNQRLFVQAPQGNQAIAPGIDNDRGFVVAAGADATLNTGDETLIVHQTLALGAAIDSSVLPMGLGVGGGTPITGAESFVPVGPGWGLMRSPGSDVPIPVFGNGNDIVLLVRY